MLSSIFIWKADDGAREFSPSSMITCYRGADWFLEDIDSMSHSYQYLSQEQGHEYLYFSVKKMPEDWIGEDLLESVEIPYRKLRQNDGWLWEQLGQWYRCIAIDTGKSIDEQWVDVNRWINTGDVPLFHNTAVPAITTVYTSFQPNERYIISGRGGGGRGSDRGGRGGGGRGSDRGGRGSDRGGRGSDRGGRGGRGSDRGGRGSDRGGRGGGGRGGRGGGGSGRDGDKDRHLIFKR
jgi:hypothetical protein